MYNLSAYALMYNLSILYVYTHTDTLLYDYTNDDT